MSDKSHIMDIKWRYSNIQKHGEKSPEGIIQRDILFFGFGKVLSLLLVQNRFSCILVIPKWSNQSYGFLLSKLVTVWFRFITRLIYHWLDEKKMLCKKWNFDHILFQYIMIQYCFGQYWSISNFLTSIHHIYNHVVVIYGIALNLGLDLIRSQTVRNSTLTIL